MKQANTFINAVDGIRYALKSEPNMRIHLLATVMVIIMGFVFDISETEWLIVIGCIVLVISMELINTTIEQLCNLVTTSFNPLIKIIKDIAAGAVLVAAAGAALMGIIIFLPKIIHQVKILL